MDNKADPQLMPDEFMAKHATEGDSARVETYLLEMYRVKFPDVPETELRKAICGGLERALRRHPAMAEKMAAMSIFASLHPINVSASDVAFKDNPDFVLGWISRGLDLLLEQIWDTAKDFGPKFTPADLAECRAWLLPCPARLQ